MPPVVCFVTCAAAVNFFLRFGLLFLGASHLYEHSHLFTLVLAVS